MVALTPKQRAVLAAVIREARANADISQETLGDRSGLNRKTISALERGKITPSLGVVIALAHGLGLPAHELVRVYGERLGGSSAA